MAKNKGKPISTNSNRRKNKADAEKYAASRSSAPLKSKRGRPRGISASPALRREHEGALGGSIPPSDLSAITSSAASASAADHTAPSGDNADVEHDDHDACNSVPVAGVKRGRDESVKLPLRGHARVGGRGGKSVRALRGHGGRVVATRASQHDSTESGGAVGVCKTIEASTEPLESGSAIGETVAGGKRRPRCASAPPAVSAHSNDDADDTAPFDNGSAVSEHDDHDCYGGVAAAGVKRGREDSAQPIMRGRGRGRGRSGASTRGGKASQASTEPRVSDDVQVIDAPTVVVKKRGRPRGSSAKIALRIDGRGRGGSSIRARRRRGGSVQVSDSHKIHKYPAWQFDFIFSLSLSLSDIMLT